MSFLRWRRWRLGVQLTVIVTTLVIAAVFSVSALSIRREQQFFQSELEDQAQLMLRSLSITALSALYLLEVESLAGVAESLAAMENTTSVRFYDKNGQKLADSETPEGVTSFEIDRFGKRLVDSETGIFDWQADQLLAGARVRAGGQWIGAVSLGLSTAPLRAKLRAVRNQGLAVAGIAALFGAALAHVVSRSIVHPLRSLVRATRRIFEGDLDQTVAAPTGRELAALADAFNQMIARLQQTLGRLARAHDDLEQRVEERTRELQLEILERRRTEADLHKAKEAAEAAAQVKSEFLANMSHEIRTPLHGVIGVGELLRMEELTEVQRRYADIILTSAETLLRLVDDILDLSKLDAAQLEVESRPFDLERCVENARGLLAPTAAEKDLVMSYRIDESCPQTVNGDSGRLGQVLVNLLGNAVKFTDAGKVHLEVSAAASEPTPATSAPAPERNVELIFTVADTGIGIPEEHIQSLFEPFIQADASMTRRYGGTGLGLAISKQLVELMGGSIWVDSELGRGSTFYFKVLLESA